MIGNSSKILLLTIIIAATAPPPVVAISSIKRCKAPSKHKLEETLGKPVKCPTGMGEICFDRNGILILARFNSSGSAERIYIYTDCVGLWGLQEVVDTIIQKNNRGKLLRRTERSIADETFTEEYKCLTMEYFQDNSRGCIPASINIVWIK